MDNDISELWVQVLRLKHKVEEDPVPYIKAKGRISHIQRGICSVWPKFNNGFKKVICDGMNTKFYTEDWVGLGEPLASLTNGPLLKNGENVKVDYMVTKKGQWNQTMFTHLIPTDMVLKIASVWPLHMQAGKDFMLWQDSNSGEFSSKATS